MSRIQRLVQDREKTKKIIIVLAIITVVSLAINYMLYQELGIFFYIGIGSVLVIGFFIYQINEYKKPTDEMIEFEEKYESFSKLYVDLTGKPNLDDLMVISIDGKSPVVGKDNYGIFLYIIDKEEEFVAESKESEIEYVEEISDEKMEELDKKAIEDDEINKLEIENFTYIESLEEESEKKLGEDQLTDKKENKYRDKYTRIRIDKKGLEKSLKRKFQTDRDTINLIYEFDKPNSRYALRYFDDVDKFTINNFY